MNRKRDNLGRFASSVLNKGERSKRAVERKKRKQALSGNRLDKSSRAQRPNARIGKRVVTRTERNYLDRQKRARR